MSQIDTTDVSFETSSNGVVYLLGIPTVDWLNVEGEQRTIFWPLGKKNIDVHLTAQPGGCLLLYSLLQSMLPDGQVRLHITEECADLYGKFFKFDMDQVKSGLVDIKFCDNIPSRIDPFKDEWRHNWTLWKTYSRTVRQATGDEIETVYRMSGWNDREKRKNEHGSFNLTVADTTVSKLVVIDDFGLDCKQKEAENGTHGGAFSEQQKPGSYNVMTFLGRHADSINEVLLKLSIDNSLEGVGLKGSEIYDRLVQNDEIRKKTTLLTTIRDLRSEPVRVGASLSWERMFEDVVRAVDNCFSGQFRRVIVNIGAAGVVIVEDKTATLVFDRSAQEGDFEQWHPGRVLGSSTCMMAALITAWAELKQDMHWPKAVRLGMSMMRRLHVEGYITSAKPRNRPVLQFPVDRLVKDYYSYPKPAIGNIGNGDEVTSAHEIGIFHIGTTQASPWQDKEQWTILHRNLQYPNGNYGDGQHATNKEERRKFHSYEDKIYRCASNIVRNGPKQALIDVPIEQVGKWRSAERNEIEGVRSVHNAMRDYLADISSLRGEEQKMKPLSIAVFGPPGAGKSFVVKEIATHLQISKDAQLTYNLSQYEASSDLAKAFHQIRDVKLQGLIPLVFWDEFDSDAQGVPFGWLRYFLAPMQDGLFMDYGAMHPVGSGIHVFAGGTSRSFREFSKDLDNDENRKAKKPDFISRVRAFIDVKGPNREAEDESGFFLIRRALLLHSYLSNVTGIRELEGHRIQKGVLDALLRTRIYYHGARSMEAIISLCTFEGKREFELSSLPPQHLLQMHVDIEDFMGLLYQTGASERHGSTVI